MRIMRYKKIKNFMAILLRVKENIVKLKKKIIMNLLLQIEKYENKNKAFERTRKIIHYIEKLIDENW